MKCCRGFCTPTRTEMDLNIYIYLLAYTSVANTVRTWSRWLGTWTLLTRFDLSFIALLIWFAPAYTLCWAVHTYTNEANTVVLFYMTILTTPRRSCSYSLVIPRPGWILDDSERGSQRLGLLRLKLIIKARCFPTGTIVLLLLELGGFVYHSDNFIRVIPAGGI